MTREEWLDAQRERGLDVDALLELGMDAFPCEDCDYEFCKGWTWGYDYEKETAMFQADMTAATFLPKGNDR